MKKILIILLILPFFSFAQCLEITEEDLIGNYFKNNLTFDRNGFFRIKGREKCEKSRWFIVDQHLIYMIKYPQLKQPFISFFYKSKTYDVQSRSIDDKFVSFLSSLSNSKDGDLLEIKYDYGHYKLYYREKMIAYVSPGTKNHFYSSLFSKNIFSDTKGCIDQFHRDNYEKWVKKGEYEKTEDYKNRVTEISKKNKSESLMQDLMKVQLIIYIIHKNI